MQQDEDSTASKQSQRFQSHRNNQLLTIISATTQQNHSQLSHCHPDISTHRPNNYWATQHQLCLLHVQQLNFQPHQKLSFTINLTASRTRLNRHLSTITSRNNISNNSHRTFTDRDPIREIIRIRMDGAIINSTTKLSSPIYL